VFWLLVFVIVGILLFKVVLECAIGSVLKWGGKALAVIGLPFLFVFFIFLAWLFS